MAFIETEAGSAMIKPRGIGDNNPPPDEPCDPLLRMPPDLLQQVVLDRARPVAMQEIVNRLIAPRVGKLFENILDMMLGPPADHVEAGSAIMQLVRLVVEPARAEAGRRRALQRQRQSRPEYKARKRERERGYREAARRGADMPARH
jgi:hypothetical protein